MGEDARPQLIPYFNEADGPEVFNAGEFLRLWQGNKPSLIPIGWDVLCRPESVQHIGDGFM